MNNPKIEPMKHNTVILYLTHIWNEEIEHRYRTLLSSASNSADIILLFDDTKNTILPENILYYKFNSHSLHKLEYDPISLHLKPGNNHFPLMQFYRDFPNYKYYWNIEYDVYFNGDWSLFFDEFKLIDIDFLSCHIEHFLQDPYWNWWDTIDTKEIHINTLQYLKSFSPIYRISNPALFFLDDIFKKGIKGHYEALIPTILNHFNYTIADISGNNDFTMEGFKEKYYKNGVTRRTNNRTSTMRTLPIYQKCDLILPNKLYHPCKNLSHE